MKLSEYIKKLEELQKKHGDVTIIYATDSEGNDYCEVQFNPSACRFDADDSENVEFWQKDHQIKVNAVCIN